jgi:superfamily II DNA/RNA helicase
MAGSDLIGQARTGTGKTLAFGIPLLQRLQFPAPRVAALVVVPTRELCVQVTGDLERAGAGMGARVLAIYGGRAFEPQIETLRRGVDVVVGTPGRLLDLARQGHLDLGGVQVLVLDEADEMLDLGFLPDVERIAALVPAERQTLLFSATMPGPVITLARRFMRQPTHLRAEEPEESQTVPTTAQHVFRAHALDKVEMLARILQAEGRGLTIVFCRTKRGCDKVAADLVERGFAAAAVHGDLAQSARERALRAFRAGKIDVLVATDVAARGIDVSGVTHVINYQCPEDEKVYLHRIGRTGRAGEDGVAVTFVDWDDVPRWVDINAALNLPFPELVETYSSSPWLYDALDIPKGTTGSLPRDRRVRAGLGAETEEDIGGRAPRTAARTPHRTRVASAPPSDEPAAPRRARSRRRTRGGDGPAASTSAASPGTGATSAPGTDTAGTAGTPRPRRRRRGRGGAGSAAATDGAAAANPAE